MTVSSLARFSFDQPSSLLTRIELKPVGSFPKKCLVFPSDKEMNLFEGYFQLPNRGFKIKRVQCVLDRDPPHPIEASNLLTVSRIIVDIALDGLGGIFTMEEAMFSAEEGNLELLKTWIGEDRSRLSLRTEDEEHLLYAALLGNQIEVMKWIHSEDRTLIHRLRKDKKPLIFLAVLGGMTQIVNWLLDEGLSCSPSSFMEMGTNLGYSRERLIRALSSIGWSIWFTPRLPVHFIDRGSLLTSIRERLTAMEGSPLKKLALIGGVGVGKSTMAAAYVARFQQSYSLIRWIRTDRSIHAELKDLAIKLGEVSITTPKHEANEKLFEYLKKNPGWLLVFDQVENQSVIDPILAKLEGGTVLITSSRWPEGDTIRLDSFSLGESLDYLIRSTRKEKTREMEVLSRTLTRCPLALFQAAAYLVKNEISEELYLGLYEREKNRFESVLPQGSLVEVVATEKITLDYLKSRYIDAYLLLSKILFFQPDEIHKSLLIDDRMLESDLDANLKILRQYGLISHGPEAGTISINPLVQSTLRSLLTEEESREAALSVYKRLERDCFIKLNDLPSLEKSKTLFHHLEAVCRFYPSSRATGFVLYIVAIYTGIIEREFSYGITLLDRSFAIRKKAGIEISQILDHLEVLGYFYLQLNDKLKALEPFEKALLMAEENYGEENPEMVDRFSKWVNDIKKKDEKEASCTIL